MLHRLGNAKEEICEILLSKSYVMDALKYSEKQGLTHLPARKFLQAALDQSNRTLYYNVYIHLRDRNLIGTNGFEVYKKHFKDNYFDE